MSIQTIPALQRTQPSSVSVRSMLLTVSACLILASCGGGGGGALTSSSTKPLVRASVSNSEAQSTDTSLRPGISSTGRYISFESEDDGLVDGDTRARDIFVRDVSGGTTEIISLDSNGDEPADGASFQSSISSDGRYVAFSSTSTALVPNDTNATYDIFVRDRQNDTLTRVSVDSMGNEGNGSSQEPHISDDGRYIAFLSAASNLVAGDTNALFDIFLHDTQLDQTSRVSVDSDGNEANGSNVRLSLSSNGRYVAFQSNASNLVAADTNAFGDVFVHDTQSGDTIRVSVDSNGIEGNGHSGNLVEISADGRYVVFSSDASNLVASDSNGVRDIFVHDTVNDTTERVSISSDADQANDDSFAPDISADGRYVVFASSASNLVEGDTNSADDIFVHDRQTGATTRIVNASDVEADDDSARPQISDDGRYVTFDSVARNLVNNDSNMVGDIFRARVR